MELATDGRGNTIGPKTKNYDESVDEPATQIENEAVDVETATPADGNLPVEQVDDNTRADAPAFEE